MINHLVSDEELARHLESCDVPLCGLCQTWYQRLDEYEQAERRADFDSDDLRSGEPSRA